MSNKKQTAVEFLESIIFGDEKFSLSEVFEQAKAMEKEQIENAFENGMDAVNIQNLEQYYKETYEL